MEKRILIFSPERRNTEDISEFVQKYFDEFFKGYEVGIQSYFNFSEPSPNDQLGHRSEEEVLVIADMQIIPPTEFKKTMRYLLLKGSFDESSKLCKELDIPFVLYDGEISKGIEIELRQKLDKQRDKIKMRLEGGVLFH